MPSPFATALARMDEDLDRHMSEEIQITPMRVGDYAAGPDPERPAFDVAALVHEQDPSSADAGGMLARVPYEEFEVEIRRQAMPAGIRLRKEDQVLLLDRSPVARLKIGRINDADRERITLVLVRLPNDD